jgi:hypothetical protein
MTSKSAVILALFVGAFALAPFLAQTQVPLPIATHTKYSFYTAQTLTGGSYHVRTPGTIARRVTLISGGGGGMGSQANMEFNETTNPIPYCLYGKMGTESCWDTHPQAVVQFNGPTVVWPGHPFHPSLDDDNPMFFTSLGTMPSGAVQWKAYYLLGSTVTPDTFEVSEKPYNPPGVPAFPPRVPAAWSGTGSGLHFVSAYRHCVTGASGGGIIGDQGLTGHSIGTRFAVPPDWQNWVFLAGANGSCAIGAGGRGGGETGAIEQFGTLYGNRGGDLTGGGGSGGGMGQNYTVIGPCGGGGGSVLKLSAKPADLAKQYTYFLAGVGGDGGIAGPGGYEGGRGGNGMVLVEEDLP